MASVLRLRTGVVVAAAAVLLAACSNSSTPPASSSTSSSSTPAATSTPGGGSSSSSTETSTVTSSADETASSESAAAGAATVETATGDLGTYLVGADGMTLYMFTPDVDGTSTCYDQCATAWPPLIVTGSPVAGAGLDQSLLSTVARTDGTEQVVYGEYPLYYYAKDTAAGDTVGQGVGSKWYVVGTDGEPIGMTEAPATS